MCTLSVSELILIHTSLSHQIVDIARNIRHSKCSLEEHNSYSHEITNIQEIIHKIGVDIENMKITNVSNNVENEDYNWIRN